MHFFVLGAGDSQILLWILETCGPMQVRAGGCPEDSSAIITWTGTYLGNGRIRLTRWCSLHSPRMAPPTRHTTTYLGPREDLQSRFPEKKNSEERKRKKKRRATKNAGGLARQQHWSVVAVGPRGVSYSVSISDVSSVSSYFRNKCRWARRPFLTCVFFSRSE